MAEEENEEVDRNVYYSRRGWSAPDIPVAFQITKQDLVILMTVVSQVRFLSTGQNRDYGDLGPADISSAITQDILDIEQIMMGGRSKETLTDNMASVPKVVVKKKGAYSPIEKSPAPKEEKEVVAKDEAKDGLTDEDTEGGYCAWQ